MSSSNLEINEIDRIQSCMIGIQLFSAKIMANVSNDLCRKMPVNVDKLKKNIALIAIYLAKAARVTFESEENYCDEIENAGKYMNEIYRELLESN